MGIVASTFLQAIWLSKFLLVPWKQMASWNMTRRNFRRSWTATLKMSQTETLVTYKKQKIHRFAKQNYNKFPSWWFQPYLKKYARQFGSVSQVGVKIKQVWNHHLFRLCSELPVYKKTFKAEICATSRNFSDWPTWRSLFQSCLFWACWPVASGRRLGTEYRL